MANYNADIRVGITGKTQLNALEKQLGRINKDLNQINKNLKAQTLTINTKGANRALDQLDRKINKLNRSINVNANINERRKSGGGGGGSSATPIALAVSPAALAAAKKTKPIAEALTNEAQKQLDLGKARERQIERLQNGFEEILKTRAQISKLAKQQQNIENKGARSAAQLFGKGTTQAEGLKKVNQELVKARKYLDVLEDTQIDINNRVVEASRAQGQYNAQLRKGAALQEKSAVAAQKRAAFSKKAGKGALAAGALGLTGVPGLGGAAQGALIGGGVGGGPGALAGAAVGATLELVGATAQYANAAAKAAAEQEKFNTALRGITSGSDYQKALEDISELSEQFIQDIGTTTEQFTKLTAATTANGISVDETAEVYRGLAAANLALGGNAERLQGILLATGQVFSKGKVQAEELRGQIGERLPGAFALFAKSVGKTPAELDKALEKGEVTVEDFVKFTKSLFEQYGENAKIIRDGPANAGARLEKALGDLQRSVGALLAPIGAAFQDTFTAIAKAINVAIEALNRFLGIGTENALAKVNQKLEDAGERLQNVKPGRKSFVNQQITNLLAEQKRLKDLQKGTAEAPTKPVSSTTDSSGSGSGSSSSSGPRDTTADLQAAIAAQRVLLQIEQERFGLTERELELRSFADDKKAREAELARKLSDIQRDNITTESKALASTLAKLQAETDLQQIKNEQQQYEAAIAADIQQQITDLETQIAVEEAITDEMKEQAILAARIAEIQDGPGSKADQKRLIDAEKRLQEAREGNQGVSGYMKQLKKELMDTEAMIVSLSQTVVSELSTAMSSAITGLIDGTKTAQEAFADMFKNIGAAFIQMATQMIAKALVMKALGILLPGAAGAASLKGPSAGAFSSGFGDMSVAGPSFFSGGMIKGWAGGGYTGNASRTGGVDGQGGFPAILHPQETVIDHTQPQSTQYSPGNEAMAVASSPGNYNINYNGPTLTFDGNQYIPRSEAQSLIAAGAKQGEARTLNALRNQRSTRSRIGI